MFARLREDIACILERDPAARSVLEVLTCYPGLHALVLHRRAHWCWGHGMRWLARFISHIGRFLTGKSGEYYFRTIKPVPYPGRTPHIHVKLRHASFGELTSQLFLAGDAGNERDFLWRNLAADERAALALRLAPAPAGSDLRWLVRHALVVPA